MAGNYNQILLVLWPYAISAFFSLLVAIAWIIAFVQLKHVGTLVLASASVCRMLLVIVNAVIWVALVQGQRQLAPFAGVVSLIDSILVGCLMVSGAFLLAFHRSGKRTTGAAG
jgi:hypothetical protein